MTFLLKRKFALVIVFLVGLISQPAYTEEDRTLLPRYIHVLLEKHSEPRDSRALSAQQQVEFINEPVIRLLLKVYRQRWDRISGLYGPDKKNFLDDRVRRYEDLLIAIAMRPERAELNQLINFVYKQERDSEQEGLTHMSVLKQIFEMLEQKTVEYTSSEIASEKETGASYAAMAVYVISEAYVRAALYNMNAPPKNPIWGTALDYFWRNSTTQKFLREFWGAQYRVNYHTLEQNIRYLELLTGKGMPDLVNEYEKLFFDGACGELLRRKLNSGPASTP